MRQIAVIVGGADNVHEEVARAREMCAAVGVEPIFVVVNDMIAEFPGACAAATLHTSKLPAWLDQRKERRFPAPLQIWTHVPHTLSTGIALDAGGSGGLFAAEVAMHKLKLKVLLCGVPMTHEGGHFVRKRRWAACHAFRDKWKPKIVELAPHVRSFSGWTMEKLGAPTTEFIMVEDDNGREDNSRVLESQTQGVAAS